jgi:hypothetical protein
MKLGLDPASGQSVGTRPQPLPAKFLLLIPRGLPNLAASDEVHPETLFLGVDILDG